MNELKEDMSVFCHQQIFTFGIRFKKHNLVKCPTTVLCYLYGVQGVSSKHQADSPKPSGQEILPRAYGLRLFRHD